MKAKRGSAELLADRLDIPANALGSMKLSLCGRSRLLIENHGGIISYGDALIVICCGKTKLSVLGDGLRLEAMSAGDMLICGRITALEFEE